MPSLTRDLAEALAGYATRRREDWDKPGCLAALARCRSLEADNVALAWIRFCADDDARTPGAFPNPTGPHWIERLREEVQRPPKADEACPVHPGGWVHHCAGCAADRLAGEPATDPPTVPTLRVVTDVADRVQHLRAIAGGA